MEYMKPRERLLVALRHEEPDRVPIDFGSMPSTGIMAIAYARLKEYLGIREGVIRVYDTDQQLASKACRESGGGHKGARPRLHGPIEFRNRRNKGALEKTRIP